MFYIALSKPKKSKFPNSEKKKKTLKSCGKALANASNFTWITFVEEDCVSFQPMHYQLV
jgi:hypothetical protein